MMTIFEGRGGGRRLAYEAAIHATLRAGHQVIAFEPGARGAARLELDGFGGIRRVLLTPPARPRDPARIRDQAASGGSNDRDGRTPRTRSASSV